MEVGPDNRPEGTTVEVGPDFGKPEGTTVETGPDSVVQPERGTTVETGPDSVVAVEGTTVETGPGENRAAEDDFVMTTVEAPADNNNNGEPTIHRECFYATKLGQSCFGLISLEEILRITSTHLLRYKLWLQDYGIDSTADLSGSSKYEGEVT